MIFDIGFLPIRMDLPPGVTVPDGANPRTLAKEGAVLIVDGQRFDFGPMPDGSILPASSVPGGWLASDVERRGEAIALDVVLPWGIGAPEATRFPHRVLAREEGPIPVPPYGGDGPAIDPQALAAIEELESQEEGA
jgi:hypothetical protein